MATRRWGISPGQNEYQVTEAVGSAVAANTIELTVDLANLAGTGAPPTRQNVLDALAQIQDWILRGVWPPA